MKYLWLTLGILWGLPTTLLGLLLAILGGARPYKLQPALCWYWVPYGLFWGWWYRPDSNWAAMTFGQITIADPYDAENETVIRHERVHTKQTWALGPLFLPVYLCMYTYELLRTKLNQPAAYRSIPLEVAAYQGQSKPDEWG